MKNIKKNRLVILVLVIIAVVLLVAGFVLNGNDDNTQGNGNEQKEQVKLEILQIPTKEIYFTYPEGLTVEQGSNSVVILNDENSLLAICYNFTNSYDGNLTGLVTSFSNQFVNDVTLLGKGNISGNIATKTLEKASFGGYAAARFTGTIKNNDGWDSYVYGYTFDVNDVPFMVVGLISSQTQDDNVIAELNELTDLVAGSVRTQR